MATRKLFSTWHGREITVRLGTKEHTAADRRLVLAEVHDDQTRTYSDIGIPALWDAYQDELSTDPTSRRPQNV